MLGPRGFLRLREAWTPGIAPLPPDGSAVAWTRPGRSVLSLSVESSVWAHVQCPPSAEVRKWAVGLGLGRGPLRPFFLGTVATSALVLFLSNPLI